MEWSTPILNIVYSAIVRLKLKKQNKKIKQQQKENNTKF